jgi:hypothetical protein
MLVVKDEENNTTRSKVGRCVGKIDVYVVRIDT